MISPSKVKYEPGETQTHDYKPVNALKDIDKKNWLSTKNVKN
jgi:hypothetical protein